MARSRDLYHVPRAPFLYLEASQQLECTRGSQGQCPLGTMAMGQGGQEDGTPTNPRNLELEYLFLEYPSHVGSSRPSLATVAGARIPQGTAAGLQDTHLTTEPRSVTPQDIYQLSVLGLHPELGMSP